VIIIGIWSPIQIGFTIAFFIQTSKGKTFIEDQISIVDSFSIINGCSDSFTQMPDLTQPNTLSESEDVFIGQVIPLALTMIVIVGLACLAAVTGGVVL